MIRSPLHAKACYLDPILFQVERNEDKYIMIKLYETIHRLYFDPSIPNLVRS